MISGLMALSFVIVILSLSSAANTDDNTVEKDDYPLVTKCLRELQNQVNEEMYASLEYMNMAAHFDRNAIARQGFAMFYRESSLDERAHAQLLIDYINLRGGAKSKFNIKMPAKQSWNNATESLNDALTLEKNIHRKLHLLHHAGQKDCHDPHLTHFLEETLLSEQVKSIDRILRYLSILTAMDSGMGEYLLDRQLQDEMSSHVKKERKF